MRRIGAVVGCWGLVAACSGCLGGPVRTVQIEVPVPVYCLPQEVAAPAIPVDDLKADADIFEVTRTLWASVEVLEAYARALRTSLEACRR